MAASQEGEIPSGNSLSGATATGGIVVVPLFLALPDLPACPVTELGDPAIVASHRGRMLLGRFARHRGRMLLGRIARHRGRMLLGRIAPALKFTDPPFRSVPLCLVAPPSGIS